MAKKKSKKIQESPMKNQIDMCSICQEKKPCRKYSCPNHINVTRMIKRGMIVIIIAISLVLTPIKAYADDGIVIKYQQTMENINKNVQNYVHKNIDDIKKMAIKNNKEFYKEVTAKFKEDFKREELKMYIESQIRPYDITKLNHEEKVAYMNFLTRDFDNVRSKESQFDKGCKETYNLLKKIFDFSMKMR